MASDICTSRLRCEIQVHYKDANRPLIYEQAQMGFVKDNFYCVNANGLTHRHPIANIWRITEGPFFKVDS